MPSKFNSVLPSSDSQSDFASKKIIFVSHLCLWQMEQHAGDREDHALGRHHQHAGRAAAGGGERPRVCTSALAVLGATTHTGSSISQGSVRSGARAHGAPLGAVNGGPAGCACASSLASMRTHLASTYLLLPIWTGHAPRRRAAVPLQAPCSHSGVQSRAEARMWKCSDSYQ